MTRQGTAARADFTFSDVFLLPADLNLAMKLQCRSLQFSWARLRPLQSIFLKRCSRRRRIPCPGMARPSQGADHGFSTENRGEQSWCLARKVAAPVFIYER
jgi:hypothetical protein